jgi:ATP synthase F1 gamma subunit
MPSTRDIRRRIKSVKNTAQITKAMQMVAAAKMRKAQQAALMGRPYAETMNQMLAEAAPRIAAFEHPLMEKREVKKRAVILVSTDRGLCGALNSNLFREVGRQDKNTTVYIAPLSISLLEKRAAYSFPAPNGNWPLNLPTKTRRPLPRRGRSPNSRRICF